MGWLWDANASKKKPDSDPFRDLDPSLKEFLIKESPVKYNPAPAPLPPPADQKPSSPPPSSSPNHNLESSESKVPSQSLYPDGRYAQLWKTYRPLSEVESETKSDQEKLLDVLAGYKERRAQIGRAAVENCVEEQMKLMECYENGSFTSRMTMCRREDRAFERCYVMQSVTVKPKPLSLLTSLPWCLLLPPPPTTIRGG